MSQAGHKRPGRGILTFVLGNALAQSARPTGMAGSGVRRSTVAMVIVALIGGGCGDGGNRTSSHVPDVRGQQARVALIHLRQSGYHHFSWAGRTSSRPVGTVLGTRPAAGTAAPHGVRVRLVMSQGPRPSRFVMVPGIGTCDVNPLPPGVTCVGGPVRLPIRR